MSIEQEIAEHNSYARWLERCNMAKHWMNEHDYRAWRERPDVAVWLLVHGL